MMDPGADDVPSSSPSTDGAATGPPQNQQQQQQQQQKSSSSRYEEQKRRDWKTFLRFLESRKPRLTLSRARSPHVIDFLKSIDHLGKTLVHDPHCSFFGRSDSPAPCSCPLRQSWGSLDALVGRLRAACDESPVRPDTNPFGVRAVRNYLLHIKDTQATARGIPYSKKRKPPPTDDDPHPHPVPAVEESTALPPCASSPNSLPTPAPLPGPSPSVPLLGPFGQDVPGQMQICWVRPPFSDNQSAPPFLPIWTYPNMQSLVPFLPPFPCVPIPTPPPATKKEKKTRIPKQESEDEEEDPGGGAMEGPSSSNEGEGSGGEAPWKQRNRYEEQKRRDWKTFLRFLENRQPRLTLSKVRSPHVMEFLKSLDQFGKTLVHDPGCQFFGHSAAAAPCICPLRQSWGSLDALVGRLRAACDESSNCPEANPFGVRAVRNYLLQVKDSQATARGIPYSRKRKRNPIFDPPPSQSLVASAAPQCASSNYQPTTIAVAAASAAISLPQSVLSPDSLGHDYFPTY